MNEDIAGAITDVTGITLEELAGLPESALISSLREVLAPGAPVMFVAGFSACVPDK